MDLNHILKILRNSIAVLMDVICFHFSKLYSIAQHALLHTSGYYDKYHIAKLSSSSSQVQFELRFALYLIITNHPHPPPG